MFSARTACGEVLSRSFVSRTYRARADQSGQSVHFLRPRAADLDDNSVEFARQRRHHAGSLVLKTAKVFITEIQKSRRRPGIRRVSYDKHETLIADNGRYDTHNKAAHFFLACPREGQRKRHPFGHAHVRARQQQGVVTERADGIRKRNAIVTGDSAVHT